MKNVRIIYRSMQMTDLEIPSELFLEDLDGPIGLPYYISEDIIKIEKKCGLIYYVINYAQNFTAEGYESSIVIDGNDLSLVVMKDYRKRN